MRSRKAGRACGRSCRGPGGSLGVVGDEVGVEHGLHLLDGLEPGAATFDAEVLVEQGAVQALDDAVGLRPLDPGLAVLDALELEEQLVGMAVGPAAELAAVVESTAYRVRAPRRSAARRC